MGVMGGQEGKAVVTGRLGTMLLTAQIVFSRSYRESPTEN